MENIRRKIELRVPAKATVWYIGSGAAARAVGALSTPIFTRLLSPEEYGLYPLYNSWLGVISVLVTLEITGTVIYRGYQKYSDNRDEFTSSALGLISALFIGFCALYFALYGVLGNLIGLSVGVSVFMMLEIYAISVLSLYLAKKRFEYKYKAVAALNLLSAIIPPIFAVLSILLTNIRAEARIYSSSAGAILIATPLFITIVKGSDKLFSGEIWLYLLRRSIPLLPHYFATALILKSPAISIGRTHGTESLGRYSVAMSIGMLLTVVTGGLMSALSPWIIRKLREGAIDKMRDFLLLLTGALSIVSLGILAFAPEMLALLAEERFRSALPAIYPLEIAVIASFLSGAIMSGCVYYEKGASTSLPAILSAGVSTALSFFVLPRIDYRFASLIALIAYLTLAIATALVFKRLSGELPIHLKKSLAILAATASYAALLFAFRTVFLSRLFLALPLIPLLLLSVRDIFKAVRE